MTSPNQLEGEERTGQEKYNYCTVEDYTAKRNEVDYGEGREVVSWFFAPKNCSFKFVWKSLG
jgi:hypothetical protein